MTGDNCPHVPVDMLHGWRVRGLGRQWDIGGDTVVDHDVRPDWDTGPRFTGGDCEDGSPESPTDRTGWPANGSAWESDERYGDVQWSQCGRGWMMWDTFEGGWAVGWTAEPIDLTVWRPL
jgi:hypothetical protein